MLESELKKNTAAVIELTTAIRELINNSVLMPKDAEAIVVNKNEHQPVVETEQPVVETEQLSVVEADELAEVDSKDLSEDFDNQAEDAQEQEKVTYEAIRALAQKAIDTDKVDGLRTIVKKKLKTPSLSDLEEDRYNEAYELLTELVNEK